MQVKRRERGLENQFRVMITGWLTSLRRIGRGPETISAASRYATQDGTRWGGSSTVSGEI
jgi:hypothetical protein